LNPRTWVLKASTLPLDHRSRLSSEYKEIKIKSRATEKETRRREKKERKKERKTNRQKEISNSSEGRQKE